MPVKRLFIALDLSDAARDTCVRHIELLRRDFANVRVGWERPEKLHITLKFLGDVEETKILDMQGQLQSVVGTGARLCMQITGPGVFPNERRPRILWIGTRDLADKVGPLEKKIEDACYSLGFAREGRPFKPHITVGRVRPGADTTALAPEHLRAHIEPVEFDVADVTMYESKLGPTGSVFEVIAKLPLATT